MVRRHIYKHDFQRIEVEDSQNMMSDISNYQSPLKIYIVFFRKKDHIIGEDILEVFFK